MKKTYTLHLSDEQFSICKLAADAEIPAALLKESFLSVTRTKHELSIVCAAQLGIQLVYERAR